MNESEKQEVEKNIKELLAARAEFFKFLDERVPKIADTDVFDFERAGEASLKEIYAKFYGYDYAARKLLPYLYRIYGLNFDV
jgi:chain length determinant protein